MMKQDFQKRDPLESYEENLRLLYKDSVALKEEQDLYFRLYFSSLIMPDMTFERAAKSVLGGQRRLASIGDTEHFYLDEKAALCRTLAEHFPQPTVLTRMFSSPKPSASIAVWEMHPTSSHGYESFSKLFSSVEKITVESFAEVCDTVANQTWTFGILPIENTIDGRLAAFYKMLDRNELKICAICDMEDSEADVVTRLALISKNLCAFGGDFTRHVEFSLVVSDPTKRAELLGVVKKIGGVLNRLSSLPLSYRTNVSVDTMRVSFSNTTCLPFLIYLHLFCEDINILGFYIQI